MAFRNVGIELEWQGKGVEEKGTDKATGKVLVEVSKEFYRPTDVVNLWGDPTKAWTVLGWNPQKTSYEELVALMQNTIWSGLNTKPRQGRCNHAERGKNRTGRRLPDSPFGP